MPGKLEESELYRRITAEDADERMPPKDSGKSLSAAEIAQLKTWIEEGAAYEGHWAFIPPVRPALPAVKNRAWCRNPIDCFILARLEARGSRPRPRPSKADAAPAAQPRPDRPAADARRGKTRFWPIAAATPTQRQVERLLASPHYGERWGRLWLDAARYADSDGYEKDKPRQVCFYRDWVINALNRDLPYDQFIIEQIAGDLLAERHARTRSSPPASSATR